MMAADDHMTAADNQMMATDDIPRRMQVFAYLPVTAAGFGFAMHADFELVASRQVRLRQIAPDCRRPHARVPAVPDRLG